MNGIKLKKILDGDKTKTPYLDMSKKNKDL